MIHIKPSLRRLIAHRLSAGARQKPPIGKLNVINIFRFFELGLKF